MKRRDLLKTAGGALAASLVPAKLAWAQSKSAISPLMTTLSTYMAEAARRPLPDAVVEKTKHMILDTLAAAISGSELPPGKFAINFARTYGGEKVASVAGSNVVCGPIEAALANGMLALAATSTAGMVRRLGGKRWRALHRLVYVAAVAGVLHYWWLVKADVRNPAVYAGIVGLLLLIRLFWAVQTRVRAAPVSRS